jgi:hypothetical protein
MPPPVGRRQRSAGRSAASFSRTKAIFCENPKVKAGPLRVALQQQEIERHVLGGSGGADGQQVQVHVPERSGLGAARKSAGHGLALLR